MKQPVSPSVLDSPETDWLSQHCKFWCGEHGRFLFLMGWALPSTPRTQDFTLWTPASWEATEAF